MATGTVKFFNPDKGFGFIAPHDGGPDVFVHVSAPERSGLARLEDGDEVSFETERDRRSGKLAAIDLKVTGSAPAGARASRPPAPRGGFERRDREPRPQANRASGGPGSGVVKWFNVQKGFGFIQPFDGGGDVFVHISAVERAGLHDLREGQPVAYEIENDRRTGKASATNLRLERD